VNTPSPSPYRGQILPDQTQTCGWFNSRLSPRYGFKAGLSDEAFPVHWFAIVLRALSAVTVYSLLCVLITGLTVYLPLAVYGYVKVLGSGAVSIWTALLAFAVGASYQVLVGGIPQPRHSESVKHAFTGFCLSRPACS